MLVESLVKATVELQGFRVVRVTGDVAGLVGELAPDGRYRPRCGQCNEPTAYRDTRWLRRFRHVLLWGDPMTLAYAPRRVVCARCQGVYVAALPWAVGQQRFARALLVTIATWTRVLPWQHVARLFGCAWGTVERAVEAAVAYGMAHRDLTGVTHIGIDEISRKKGHVYVTNVYDLARKRLLRSGEGRSQATLAGFFEFLGPAAPERPKGSAATCGSPTSPSSGPGRPRRYSCSTSSTS